MRRPASGTITLAERARPTESAATSAAAGDPLYHPRRREASHCRASVVFPNPAGAMSMITGAVDFVEQPRQPRPLDEVVRDVRRPGDGGFVRRLPFEHLSWRTVQRRARKIEQTGARGEYVRRGHRLPP